MEFRPAPQIKYSQFDIPRTLDDLFNSYRQIKSRQQQEASEDTAMRKEYNGVNPTQMTPEQRATGFAGPTVIPGVPQQAMTPRGAGSPGEFASDPTQPQMQFDKNELVARLQQHVLSKRQREQMGVQKGSLEIDKTRSEINENNAQAEALRADQTFFDPATGKTMRVPRGAKPLPAGTGQQGKMIAAPTILNFNEGQSVSRLLPDVEKAIDTNSDLFGPVSGRMSSANPYNTRARTVDAEMRTASQAFGRYMEGGVLRKEDEEKYRKMFPQLSDTSEVAKNKLQIVSRILSQKFNSDRGALGDSGYDVSGVPGLSTPPSVFGGGPSVGTIEDGYRFKGGNKADPSAWEKVR